LKTILSFLLFSGRTSLRKTKNQNIIFLLLISFMQACLEKIVLQNLPYSIWVAFFKPMSECESQLLFYKILFPYFSLKELFLNLIAIPFMQAKPLGLIKVFY
jgi:hypothetical protein